MPNFREELWYSIGIFGTFSLAGLLLSVTSLYLVRTLLRVRLSSVVSEPMVLLVLLLSGLGVFLGRFVRLNTWDLVTDPRTVLSDLTEKLGIRPMTQPALFQSGLRFAAGDVLHRLLFAKECAAFARGICGLGSEIGSPGTA